MKQKQKINRINVFSLVLATLLMIPCSSFAEGEDVNSTVEAFANATNGNVQKDVGNVNVSTDYFPNIAFGIYATASDEKTATVTAQDVTVSGNALLKNGIDATAGSDQNNSYGKIYIKTRSVNSKGDGILVSSHVAGSELSVTTTGKVLACVDRNDDSCDGVYGYAANSGKLNMVLNAGVEGTLTGIGIRPAGEGLKNNGTVDVKVYGDVKARGKGGIGLLFNGSANTCSVLITGNIVGSQYGILTRSFAPYMTDMGDNNLMVWGISAPDGNLVMKEKIDDQVEVDDDFAKKINYIIMYADDVSPSKPDGSALDIKDGYNIAKEEDRVIVGTVYDGVTIKKAFNNGVEIKTKDELGRFYVDIKRGGRIFLTVEYEKAKNPITLKGKTIKARALVLEKRKLTRAFAKAVKVTNKKGELSYKKKKGVKKVVIDKTTGKITIKKGLKKGKYKIRVNVTAAGDDFYNPITKAVTFTLNVM